MDLYEYYKLKETIIVEIIAQDTLNPQNEIEAQIEESIQLAETKKEKNQVTNKRVDFDKKTLRRIETMIPLYSEDLSDSASTSEIFSYVIQKAVDTLFEGEFKKNIENI